MAALSPTLLKRLFRFALVGGIGFIVDVGLTLGLIHQGADPYSSRILGLALAMLTTWRLNRALTFGPSDTTQASEGVRYFVVAILTALLNYLIYAGLLLSISGMMPVFAVVLATGVSMIASYLGYSRFAFRSGA